MIADRRPPPQSEAAQVGNAGYSASKDAQESGGMIVDSSYTQPTTYYWQQLLDGWPDVEPQPPYRYSYPVRLPDGKVLVLPLRQLPDGTRAVASFIANQAALDVVTALANHMVALARTKEPEVVVGLPTLGLTFAPLVAERLGFKRYVPLGYSRKFWYDDAMSVPIASLTSPHGQKRLYLDPNMLPLLRGRRICLVDDAVSTGSSLLAALQLLKGQELQISSVVVAMKQTLRWSERLSNCHPEIVQLVAAVFGCPLFVRGEGAWLPLECTQPSIP